MRIFLHFSMFIVGVTVVTAKIYSTKKHFSQELNDNCWVLEYNTRYIMKSFVLIVHLLFASVTSLDSFNIGLSDVRRLDSTRV